MTERPFIALGLALVVESAHWLRFRWNFDQFACIRAWQVSILTAGAVAVFIWLDGDRITILHRIIGWLPALFLPMQFTQSFGLREAMPLSTFSFFARQRQLRNERLGLRDTSTRLNFGNIYFVCCLIGATLGPQSSSPFFLPGLLSLIAWLLLASRQTTWLSLAFAVAIAGSFAVAGQTMLTTLYQKTMRYHRGGDQGLRSPDAVETAIGSLGEIKQSPEIKWRVSVPAGQPNPRLLRSANFNRYSSGKWKNSEGVGLGSRADFLTLDEKPDGSDYYVFRSKEEQADPPASLPVFSMRGSVEPETQLPLPGNTASIRGFALDGVLHNSLGTIRITPKNSVIQGTVRWQHHPQLEDPPMKADNIIPPAEQQAVKSIAEELKLAELPTLEAKMDTIARWFSKEFEYTRYLSIRRETGPGFSSAMSIFLTKVRKGHCEYFATSAALLLRASGVPTRYAIGYVVREKDEDIYLVRGTHAHSWCRAWDEKTSTWVDFDATPGNWLALEPSQKSAMQDFSDAYLKLREDFGLWRTDPANRTGLGIGMGVVGFIALLFISHRLWRSKHVVASSQKAKPRHGKAIRTPLHDLESPARRLLGPRPAGLPFSRWLLGLKPRLGESGELEQAIAMHQRLRYDPAPPEDFAEPLERLVKTLKARLET
jgi:protein-glutamine gamma-glutamyltransferase